MHYTTQSTNIQYTAAMKLIKSLIIRYLDNHTRQIFDVDKGKLKHVPNAVIWSVYIMSISVLVQGLADVIIKVLGFIPGFVKMPLRIDFIFLTAISVLMGYQALKGMRRRELDVTRNSVQVGLLVEVALVVSDILFITTYKGPIPFIETTRLPFVVLTTINIGILLYVSASLRLFKDKNNAWQLF